jgi:hypothetical protein
MPNHYGVGVAGFSEGDHGKGVVGYALHATGTTIGVRGNVVSRAGRGGLFENYGGGDILVGSSCNGVACDPVDPQASYMFRVDNHGRGYFNGGYQTSGADFAESFAVAGARTQYEPGDLLAIDDSGDRRLSLTREPYSTLVAGVYSTKPGVLATPHEISSREVDGEVPLAVVGVVPCKVTAENGPIRRGDLLVSSSKAGYAMKGSDRSRLMGAVVGKALQALPTGEGVIEVLVTLQ